MGRIVEEAVKSGIIPFAIAQAADSSGVYYSEAAGIPVDAICAIASMTKPVTAVAAMQLVERGLIELDAPACRYAEELSAVQVLKHGELRPPKTTPTVRQLLSHTSGFGYEMLSPELAAFIETGQLVSLMAGGDAFLQAPLLFDPGTRWEYGIGMDWAGKIVERVSGQRLDEYFADHIFAPLQMTDTFYEVPPEKAGRVAPIYRGEQRLNAVRPDPFGFCAGGTGLFSTASDYLRFCLALLRGGGPILRPESVAEIGRNQIGHLTLRPFHSVVAGTITEGSSMPGGFEKFGLGVALGGPDGRTLAWPGLFNTFFWIDQVAGVAAVFLTQTLPSLEPGVCRVVADFLDTLGPSRTMV